PAAETTIGGEAYSAQSRHGVTLSRARAFQPHARAKKLPRAAECLVYSLTPSGVLAENHPKNRGFVGIFRGQKCRRRVKKCLRGRFFPGLPRGRVVSRRALDASVFWHG